MRQVVKGKGGNWSYTVNTRIDKSNRFLFKTKIIHNAPLYLVWYNEMRSLSNLHYNIKDNNNNNNNNNNNFICTLYIQLN